MQLKKTAGVILDKHVLNTYIRTRKIENVSQLLF